MDSPQSDVSNNQNPVSFASRRKGRVPQPWKPFSLRAPVLAAVIIVSIALIIILQLILQESQSNQGIIFASDINYLPLSRSFSYLYFPTILAVLYSILWSWVDLDTKRLEPYHQLSKPNGALGKDSLLLHYPFDFIASVPIKAVRNRHWPVFWASSAIVLVFWGLTPSQAGIFATKTITQNVTEPMLVSKSFLPVSDQDKLDSTYAYSVFGMTWLGEDEPSYMTRELALSPFRSNASSFENSINETWTATIPGYGADVTCEPARVDNWTDAGSLAWFSSSGCQVPMPFGTDGNDTMGRRELDQIRKYTGFYAGYDNEDGMASYYLATYCPKNASNTFLATFTQNKIHEEDSPKRPTAVFCELEYYEQDIETTVLLPDDKVIATTPKGPKRVVPEEMFSRTTFEAQTNARRQRQQVRGEMPIPTWPDQGDRMSDMNITLDWLGIGIHYMVGIAVGSYPRPLEDYLDPTTLGNAFGSAYKMLFARLMVDILDGNFTEMETVDGVRETTIQAVVVVPAFTYLSEVLLAAVASLAAALLFLSWTRPRKLHSDPATIAAMMSLTADSDDLLRHFDRLDTSTDEEIGKAIGKKRFKLEYDGKKSVMVQVPSDDEENATDELADSRFSSAIKGIRSALPMKSQEKQGIRVMELRTVTAVVFCSTLFLLIIGLAVLFTKARPHGLLQPPGNDFVKQLLTNYLPLAVATFLEPIWVVINRLICLLQPFEQLRTGRARARRSIALDSTSLPPQLVFWKALRSGCLLLAVVCGMALLANILAIAFSGLFFVGGHAVPAASNFTQSLLPRVANSENLAPANGSLDQFYYVRGNLTSGALLPQWTDKKFFYLPFTQDESPASRSTRRATTTAFGVRMECRELKPSTENSYTIQHDDGFIVSPNEFGSSVSAKHTNISITVDLGAEGTVSCRDNVTMLLQEEGGADCPTGPIALEIVEPGGVSESPGRDDDAFCQSVITAAWLRGNGPDACRYNGTIREEDATVLACIPNVVVGSADVTVDDSNHVVQAKMLEYFSDIARFFDLQPPDLIKQFNRILRTRPATDTLDARGTIPSWHNDTFASEMYNYLIAAANNESRLLDPTTPPPSFESTAKPVEDLYEELFAVFLGDKSQKLFVRAESSSALTLQGTTFTHQERLFISTPMFILSEVILSVYAVVAVALYLKRPGRFLPRLPTTMASIIATFSSSKAVEDLKGTAGLTKRERSRLLNSMDHKYGYGAYVGADGRVHIGIERQPFVRPTSQLGGRKMWSWKKSDSDTTLGSKS
ncbi:hypothetical protein BDY21DRAFT_66539 [Lineolata rhizophorae]|uniref:DUF3433 domain protein n=1 Tax=Lineolata rhizophorae TaxID=578093 RepID=A0A6A6NW53_9PEZI|nr:hypothetical protein BDY21DRAFT_66539 [Lineolata rhizophorae]